MFRWTVRDVMTVNVVTVTAETPYKQIVEQLVEHAVSAVPVVDDRGAILGVISEADLLHKVELTGLERHVDLLKRRQQRVAMAKASGDIARALMSSPVVTVGPDVSVSAAARMMDDRRVKRLPVVDEHGRVIGIVSRGDLLRLYLRDDATIRDDIIGEVLLRTLWIDPGTITVSVHGGVVTLGGAADRLSTAQIAVRLCRSVAGVVDVIDEMTYDYDDTADLHRHNVIGAKVKETTP